MEKTDETIHILNRFIEVCKDGENGFREAARDVRNDRFKNIFHDYADRMEGFAVRLEDEVIKLGGVPRRKGTLVAALHRAWIHVRSIVNLYNPRPALIECERGEKKALDVYQEALDLGTVDEAKELVERQFVELIEIRDRLLEMDPRKAPELPAGILHLETELKSQKSEKKHF